MFYSLWHSTFLPWALSCSSPTPRAVPPSDLKLFLSLSSSVQTCCYLSTIRLFFPESSAVLLPYLQLLLFLGFKLFLSLSSSVQNPCYLFDIQLFFPESSAVPLPDLLFSQRPKAVLFPVLCCSPKHLTLFVPSRISLICSCEEATQDISQWLTSCPFMNRNDLSQQLEWRNKILFFFLSRLIGIGNVF